MGEDIAMANQLPAGFEALEPFVERFALDTTADRAERRSESTREERAAFHAAMQPLVGAALDLLDTRGLDKLDPAEQRLMNLALAYTHVALAVEVHGPDEERHARQRSHMRITRSPADATA